MQLGHIARLRRPIIHLRVNVQGVVAAPRRPRFFVPDPLKIGGLRSRTGAGDQQIASVMEQQLHQPRVAASVFGDSPIGRHVGRGFALTEMKGYPIKEPGMILKMPISYIRILLVSDGPDRLGGYPLRVALGIARADARIELVAALKYKVAAVAPVT